MSTDTAQELASLKAAVTELETWKEYLSGNITKIQDDEADYKSELNTFYLMWAGTPLPPLPPRCALSLVLRALSRRSQVR